MSFDPHPTWEEDIKQLFTEPYWIPPEKRKQVAKDWYHCMKGYEIRLHDYESVCQWSVTVYQHLKCGSMPLTDDKSQLWPEDALEQLRIWINEGTRKTPNEHIHFREVLPHPKPRPFTPRIRKNILHLTEAELNDYRMRVEALGTNRVGENVLWQELAYIHTNWCLHYQEAFIFWHRAFLLYVEEKLGCAIPYWDFMSPHATEDGHPEAGLIQPFKDESYFDPITQRERQNPLRYAVAKDGKSKACQDPKHEVEWQKLCRKAGLEYQCKYVQRDPVLYTEGGTLRRKRLRKLALMKKFQLQIAFAFAWPTFSSPEGSLGYPWANIQTFDPPPPDSSYPHRCDFDGLYEQPHDNFHGWLGPDMADNSYTAFDPVFLSYHANIDRIFEEWKRNHLEATYTAAFPIRPFVGSTAREVDYTDRRDYLYTTIGDMARDSRTIGYDYEAPKEMNLVPLTPPGGPVHLYVLFTDVKCLQDSYTIDVFLNLPDPKPHHITDKPDNYVGRFTRLGMGVEDDKGRCIVKGVTRVLDAGPNVYALHLTPESKVTLDLIVTDLTTGKRVPPDEYKGWPGFVPIARWGGEIPTTRPAATHDHSQHEGHHSHH